MNDEIFRMFLYFVGICYVLGIAIWVSKKTAVKHATTISGPIINIEPHYRYAYYTVELSLDEEQFYQTFTRRSRMSGLRLHSKVFVYVIPTKYGLKYKPVQSYYNIVWYLLIAPWLILLLSIFGIY